MSFGSLELIDDASCHLERRYPITWLRIYWIIYLFKIRLINIYLTQMGIDDCKNCLYCHPFMILSSNLSITAASLLLIWSGFEYINETLRGKTSGLNLFWSRIFSRTSLWKQVEANCKQAWERRRKLFWIGACWTGV